MEGVTHTESFRHSDPAWRVPIELPTSAATIDDIRPGDIVYVRRPKGYQRLTALAGDTWRHIGVATAVGGYPWLLEMAPFGCMGRPLTSVMAMYDTVAIQRLAPCDRQCHITLVNRVAAELNRPTSFHERSELVGIGLLSWTRLLRAPGRVARATRSVLADRLTNRDGFYERAICSTAIARCIGDLCDEHRVQLDTWTPKHGGPRSDSAKGSTQFALPDDIWRALQPTSQQHWVKKNGAPASEHSPTIDLTDNEKGGHAMALGT